MGAEKLSQPSPNLNQTNFFEDFLENTSMFGSIFNDDICGLDQSTMLELFVRKLEGNPEAFEFQYNNKSYIC